jgi:hypothetical protein
MKNGIKIDQTSEALTAALEAAAKAAHDFEWELKLGKDSAKGSRSEGSLLARARHVKALVALAQQT